MAGLLTPSWTQEEVGEGPTQEATLSWSLSLKSDSGCAPDYKQLSCLFLTSTLLTRKGPDHPA